MDTHSARYSNCSWQSYHAPVLSGHPNLDEGCQRSANKISISFFVSRLKHALFTSKSDTTPASSSASFWRERKMPRLSLTSLQKTGSYRVVSHHTSCTFVSSPPEPCCCCCSAFDFLTWSSRELSGPQQVLSCLPVHATGLGTVTSAIAVAFTKAL